MDLLNKFNELHEKGYPLNEIVENIFLNYNAYTNNDDVYIIKKQIADEFNVEINNVKLIGSSHTGFKNFVPREITKDYDFAIIDPFLFREYLLKVDINKVSENNQRCYTLNLSKGKMHILYVSNEVKMEVEEKLEKVKSKTKDSYNITIDKSVSVCFYVSERSFIKNLCSYFTSIITKSMKESVPDIKEVEKIH